MSENGLRFKDLARVCKHSRIKKNDGAYCFHKDNYPFYCKINLCPLWNRKKPEVKKCLGRLR